jgi:hypothetical protein
MVKTYRMFLTTVLLFERFQLHPNVHCKLKKRSGDEIFTEMDAQGKLSLRLSMVQGTADPRDIMIKISTAI